MNTPIATPTDAAPLNTLTASELLARLARGETTPAEIVQACAARIALRESQVRAWAWFEPEAALAQARALDGAASGLPLRGVPVGIKDIIDTADMPTEYGSALYAGHQPAADAEAVRRLRAAGAVILGKTVTTEFAYSHPGPTANPHDPGHTPGGSSSGSAAAVADMMVPVALGTQTGGSTIRPAAYCGIAGFKPTFGAVPLAGVRPLSASMDTMGIHARSVDDLRRVYAVLSATAPAPAGPADAAGGLRIACCPGFLGEHAGADARRALQQAQDAMARAGAHVVPLALPETFVQLGDANRDIMAYEAARSSGQAYDVGRAKLAPVTRELIERGRAMPQARYRQALDHVAACREALARLMCDTDALLTYSAPGEAPPMAQGTGDSVFNRVWTTLGVPCLTLPWGRGAGGLPLGVQLVGAHGDDAGLLRAGAWLETLLPAPRG